MTTCQQSTAVFVDMLISVQKYFRSGYVTFLHTDNLTDKCEFNFLHPHGICSWPVPVALKLYHLSFGDLWHLLSLRYIDTAALMNYLRMLYSFLLMLSNSH
jgi:hypothetical protein